MSAQLFLPDAVLQRVCVVRCHGDVGVPAAPAPPGAPPAVAGARGDPPAGPHYDGEPGGPPRDGPRNRQEHQPHQLWGTGQQFICHNIRLDVLCDKRE